MAAVKSALGSHYQDLEIVEAELLNEDSMMKAIEGSTYVAHHASPYYLDNKTREELVEPAVQGTVGTMKACTAWGIKRCVFTSSFACIRWTTKEGAPPDNVFDERYWSSPDREGGMGDYAASKVLAEMAGWDYQKANPGFEVVTICPTLILGPGIGSPNVVSQEFVKSIMEDTSSSIKCASNYYVDVRDVAKAHIRAIEVPEAANKRFMVHSEHITVEEIRDTLAKHYGSKGFKPGCDKIDAKGALGIKNDNSASINILGMDYIPAEKTLIDMADSMFASGVLKSSG
jgi:dihydroflavonol-4-reductase